MAPFSLREGDELIRVTGCTGRRDLQVNRINVEVGGFEVTSLAIVVVTATFCKGNQDQPIIVLPRLGGMVKGLLVLEGNCQAVGAVLGRFDVVTVVEVDRRRGKVIGQVGKLASFGRV